jgi:dienelactone hydrolase
MAAAAAAAAAVLCFAGPTDYQYNMVPDSNYGPGMFHEGFLRVANQLWNNGMQEALDTAVAAGDIKHIIITGHSLGGASTTLLSARAQVGRGIGEARQEASSRGYR